jgi:hypothetical protein
MATPEVMGEDVRASDAQRKAAVNLISFFQDRTPLNGGSGLSVRTRPPSSCSPFVLSCFRLPVPGKINAQQFASADFSQHEPPPAAR